MRFSQAISEGDGISVIVEVRDVDAARAAAAQGAEAVLVRSALASDVDLPVLWRGSPRASDAAAAGADAWVVSLEEAADAGDDHELDRVVQVSSPDELERVLEQFDPEIVLFCAGQATDTDPLQLALDLLADLPAGKLAIAEVPVSRRGEVDELERAGVDAVIVGDTVPAG